MRIELTAEEIEQLLTVALERMLRLQEHGNESKVAVLNSACTKLRATNRERAERKER